MDFLRKYQNFIVFIVLEIVALVVYFYNNAYPRSVFFSSANSIIAFQRSVQKNISDYFFVNRFNRQLMMDNNKLYNEYLNKMHAEDSAVSLGRFTSYGNKYNTVVARVVNLTGLARHNYYTIDRGTVDGVKENMGVCNTNGVVGVVKTAGRHYSLVVPLIHDDLRISCRVARNKHLGVVQWGGRSIEKGVLLDIPIHVDISLGDTIVTSGLSSIYPADLPIGLVTKIDIRKGNPHYDIEIKFFADFSTIEYVYVIENLGREEQLEIEKYAD